MKKPMPKTIAEDLADLYAATVRKLASRPPTTIQITERPAQPSGIRDWQIEALRLALEATQSTSQKERFEMCLIAMGEQP